MCERFEDVCDERTLCESNAVERIYRHCGFPGGESSSFADESHIMTLGLCVASGERWLRIRLWWNEGGGICERVLRS